MGGSGLTQRSAGAMPDVNLPVSRSAASVHAALILTPPARAGCGASGTPSEILAALFDEARPRLIRSSSHADRGIVSVVGDELVVEPFMATESIAADAVIATVAQRL